MRGVYYRGSSYVLSVVKLPAVSGQAGFPPTAVLFCHVEMQVDQGRHFEDGKDLVIVAFLLYVCHMDLGFVACSVASVLSFRGFEIVRDEAPAYQAHAPGMCPYGPGSSKAIGKRRGIEFAVLHPMPGSRSATSAVLASCCCSCLQMGVVGCSSLFVRVYGKYPCSPTQSSCCGLSGAD
jgi:hypothetical protein